MLLIKLSEQKTIYENIGKAKFRNQVYTQNEKQKYHAVGTIINIAIVERRLSLKWRVWLWCLMPLPIIFQLYRGRQIY